MRLRLLPICLTAFTLACSSNDENNNLGTIDIPTASIDHPAAPDNTPPPVETAEDDDETSNEAQGRLLGSLQNGPLFTCAQSTRFTPDVLAVFRVSPSGAQGKPGFVGPGGKEHSLSAFCDAYIQIDCLVRSDAQNPSARPKAGNLYAATYGTLECPTPTCIDCGPAPRCEPLEREVVGRQVIPGEWSECKETDLGYGRGRIDKIITTYTDGCERSQEVTYERNFEPCNICDNPSNDNLSSSWTSETNGCEPPPEECELPDIGSIQSWQGQGNPTAECAAFGDYVPGPPGFTICKAGNDREVVANGYSSDQCPNGKDLSHLTTCACPTGD